MAETRRRFHVWADGAFLNTSFFGTRRSKAQALKWNKKKKNLFTLLARIVWCLHSNIRMRHAMCATEIVQKYAAAKCYR